MSKKHRLIIIIFFLIQSITLRAVPGEGMYPLSELKKLDLKKLGFNLNLTDIYNPEGMSLINAIVNIGGCTGSFVSENGLILTNHHCAFGAVSRASTPENNYLENGFYAAEFKDEIPAAGYTVRITESYKDVSQEVLTGLENVSDFAERSRMIEKRMNEIAAREKDESKAIDAEVSEMFPGKTYILFKYKIIKDVRLVYVPPRSIGEFGGETDNWMWPRHTGDFSFLRAYVAPDGSSAEYSENNVPFHPQKFLKINPNGVKENDFVFILGYPGSTYRNYPAWFLDYQQNYFLPYNEQLYSYLIDALEKLSKDNKSIELKYAPFIKGFSNAMKNYRGKMLGIRKLELLKKEYELDRKLKEFIDKNPDLAKNYNNLFNELESTYNKMFDNIYPSMWLNRLYRFSNVINYADAILNQIEGKPTNEIDKIYQRIDLQFERVFLKKMLEDALNISELTSIEAVTNFVKDTDAETFLNKLLSSDLLNEEKVAKYLKGELDCSNVKPEEDLLLTFTALIKRQKDELKEISDYVDGKLNLLLPQYIEIKKLYEDKSFIPDANGTLRMTYGNIKGYEPRDAVYYKPISTLDGVIEKSYLGKEYAVPDNLRIAYDKKNFGEFFDASVGGVPVAILYNTDTTGGNSGSPVMNANGELIGLNFDRCFEATINDYAWDDSYSRSIGVDIRYILWISKYVNNAERIVKELVGM
ncbi:S46 family peptidase [Melioribacter sp. OK-6-Me]|uniref:S46 family peptidase n=1 Tax=unclassified Melioribacter TaxID=2627329 RepID=UPI003EDA15CD